MDEESDHFDFNGLSFVTHWQGKSPAAIKGDQWSDTTRQDLDDKLSIRRRQPSYNLIPSRQSNQNLSEASSLYSSTQSLLTPLYIKIRVKCIYLGMSIWNPFQWSVPLLLGAKFIYKLMSRRGVSEIIAATNCWEIARGLKIVFQKQASKNGRLRKGWSAPLRVTIIQISKWSWLDGVKTALLTHCSIIISR